MVSDRAFQTIVSGSVLAKFGSFRTPGIIHPEPSKKPLGPNNLSSRFTK